MVKAKNKASPPMARAVLCKKEVTDEGLEMEMEGCRGYVWVAQEKTNLEEQLAKINAQLQNRKRVKAEASEPMDPEEGEDEDSEDGENETSGKYGMVYDPQTGKVLSEAAIEQRLRRACKNGKKKKATGGPKAVEMYKDVDARDELARILISAAFKRNITKYSEKKHTKKTDTIAGWYTEQAMFVQLEEINEIVEYTSTRPTLRRKYKYNAKKLQHWVDKESIGVDSSETIKGTRKEVSTNARELPEEAGCEISDIDEEEGPEGMPSGTSNRQEEDIVEKAEKTLSDMLPSMAKMHELAEKHAKELERIAANMEGMYDSLSEVLADGNANGASASGESIWTDARSRLDEPLQQSGHALKVDIDFITVTTARGTAKIPWLDPYKMVSCLGRNDKLHLLHGGNNLLEWWRRFSKVEPGHRVFAAAARGEISLQRAIPFFSHGDEGRGKKKKGILIWSLRGCVGFGTRQFKEFHSEAEQCNRMGLNMTGSMSSRFLHVAVPKSVYGKQAEPVWDDIGYNIATSYKRLEQEGFVASDGKQYYAVCVGLTGDNPFLAKIGHLERSFARVSKRSGEDVCQGICWRCLAGTPNIPFENLNLNPEWCYTVDEVLPWSQLPAFLQGLGFQDEDMRAPRFLEFDIWHKFHGGTGKHIAASTVAEILPNLDVGSIDFKFCILAKAYDSWRQKSKLTLHIGHFDRELFGMEQGYQVLPAGCWSKFDDTRILLCFLEDFLRDRALYVPTEITEEALVCIAAANRRLAMFAILC
ncbi:hypothetical protein AK812_SmicGene4984 [Symbiodinium microadriaticum]|uniref:Uncharacterized protein n=1 Tax=Symbiodinium microadriaticum TaxID=2951 RepID=A0A1Q9EUV7_SYMMI|nr:hypothetical protein AK812_SmicGene4984 [Symbiodinium microadriaticum]